MRVVRLGLGHVLAALIFLAPAVYLVQVWPREAPPATTEVDSLASRPPATAIRSSCPVVHVISWRGRDVTGTDKRGAALALVRSQIARDQKPEESP